MNYKLICKHKEFIVIEKPAGLLTHGSPKIKDSSLIEQVLIDFPEIAKIGEDPMRPGLVHRLDKLVSGLLVIARTQNSFDNLKNQFKKRLIKKYYTALVYGQVEKDEDKIVFPIKRSAQGNKMAALPALKKGLPNPDGRRAISKFVIIKKYINYTLLRVQLKTGRTHQIRVHMAAYGHPLVGDNLYATKKTKAKNQKLDLDRIYLHAHELSFSDLKNKTQTLNSELPKEFVELLNKIK